VVLELLDKVRPQATGQYMAGCPAHADRNPSLSVSEGEDGKVLLYCQAHCDTADVLRAMGLDWRDLNPSGGAKEHGSPRRARADGALPRPPAGQHAPGTEARELSPVIRRTPLRILDSQGRHVATHVRLDHADGTKRFSWERPDGTAGLGGIKSADLPLYGSEHLAACPRERVVVTEGEKAADALGVLGVLTVATVTGAASTPSAAVLESLQGREVILWPDADEAGRAHMDRVARVLVDLGIAVRLVDWAEAPDKGDAADCVHGGATSTDLDALLDAACAWEPSAVTEDVAALLAKLAQLEEVCARQRDTIATVRAENDEHAARFQSFRELLGNKKLPGTLPRIALSLSWEAHSAEDRQANMLPGGEPATRAVSLEAIAKRAGVSESAAQRGVALLTRGPDAPLRKDTYTMLAERVDRKTGEVKTRPHSIMQVMPVHGRLSETLAAYARYVPGDLAPWGGYRHRCKQHPTAAVNSTTKLTCAECATVVHTYGPVLRHQDDAVEDVSLTGVTYVSNGRQSDAVGDGAGESSAQQPGTATVTGVFQDDAVGDGAALLERATPATSTSALQAMVQPSTGSVLEPIATKCKRCGAWLTTRDGRCSNNCDDVHQMDVAVMSTATPSQTSPHATVVALL